MQDSIKYKDYEPGSAALIEILVAEHIGWASSIARSVARAWNMDWQLDGLDGGAYEGLLFCAGRYDASTNVPFKAYARRRVHEAATEEARKSKSWQRKVGSDSEAEQSAREISACLFGIFPELRDGVLPHADGEFTDLADATRNSIRQLLVSASLFLSSSSTRLENPDKALEYRELFSLMATLENVHQQIIWNVYWQGLSQRNLAEEWKVDELAIIREHKEILAAMQSALSSGKSSIKKLKVRPVLRQVAVTLLQKKVEAPFQAFAAGFIVISLLCALSFVCFMCVRLLSGW